MRFVIALFAVILAAVANDAAARDIEPGQWRITTTMSSPILSGPQTTTSTQCVTREDLKDPRRAWRSSKRTPRHTGFINVIEEDTVRGVA